MGWGSGDGAESEGNRSVGENEVFRVSVLVIRFLWIGYRIFMDVGVDKVVLKYGEVTSLEVGFSGFEECVSTFSSPICFLGRSNQVTWSGEVIDY